MVISELGITIAHPTTDFNMGAQFSADEIAGANSLTSAIQAGTLVWKLDAGGATQAAADYDPDHLEVENLSTGQKSKLSEKPIVLAMTVAASNNTTTWTAIAELTTPILEPGTYRFEAHLIARSTNAATGLGTRLGQGTGVMGYINAKWEIPQGVDGVSKNYCYDQQAATTDLFSASVAANNTDFIVKGHGVFTVTTRGTFAIQHRSETATNTSLRANSNLIIQRVA